jgi:hypothetical protein
MSIEETSTNNFPRLQSYNWIVSSSPAVTHQSPVSSKSTLVIRVPCLLENRFEGLNVPNNCPVIGRALILRRVARQATSHRNSALKSSNSGTLEFVNLRVSVLTPLLPASDPLIRLERDSNFKLSLHLAFATQHLQEEEIYEGQTDRPRGWIADSFKTRNRNVEKNVRGKTPHHLTTT